MISLESCSACGQSSLARIGELEEGDAFTCRSCGTTRLIMRLPRGDTESEYGRTYRAGFDCRKLNAIHALFQRLFPFNASEFHRILDVGCGNGAFLDLVRRDGWSVLGIDPDAGAVVDAAAMGIDVVQGKAGEAALPASHFDVVTLWDVIEHVENPIEVATWLSTIVRPEGRLVVLTPNGNSIIDSLARIEKGLSRGRSGRMLSLCVNRHHLHRFTSGGLVALFGSVGFKTEEIHPIQLFSLRPACYLSGCIPGIRGWTDIPAVDARLSRVAYALVTLFGVRNKVLYVGSRVRPAAGTGAEDQSA